MSFKTKPSSTVEKAVRKAQDFETTLMDIRKRSEKRAWIAAGASVFMSLCMLGGLAYVLPLKEKVPYLVFADSETGSSTIARLDGKWPDSVLNKENVINRSNINQFVIAHESFDEDLINLRDWVKVFAMSSTPVANDYKAYMDMANPNTPFKIYGKNQSIRIKVSSIVLNDENKENKGATVRFQRFLFDKQTGGSRYLDNKIATLTFTYKDNLRMEEKYRYENPLGFQVLSYRVDSDLSTPSLENKVLTNQTSGLEPVAQSPTNTETIPSSTTSNAQVPSASTTPTTSVQNPTSPIK